MIPKIIHYCWFGGNPLPELAQRCIASWKKYLPGYEIKEWNEDNFDINVIPYTADAYKAKKYAFVSDYARFWILYHFGGIYFDTDVEVIKPLDDILVKGAFLGCESTLENHIMVASGLGMAAEKGNCIYEDILKAYEKLLFITKGRISTTVVWLVTNHLFSIGLKNIKEIQEVGGITIYPEDYFCPKDCRTGNINITSNTRTIHHGAASWVGKESLFHKIIRRIKYFFSK